MLEILLVIISTGYQLDDFDSGFIEEGGGVRSILLCLDGRAIEGMG